MNIDLNCDMGESYGNFKMGNDEAVFPYITSCNIACGFHGGDPIHIEKTIQLAIQHGVKMGAHPSYPDLGGFGRRKMVIPLKELTSIVKYQVAALKGLVESYGEKLHYVKPHGALYNSMADNREEAASVMEGIREIDPFLIVMGLAGSEMEQIAQEKEIPFVAEAFADRQYLSNGRLMPRSRKGSVIHDPEKAAEQVLHIAREGKVKDDQGNRIQLNAQTICIHGDNPGAVNILQAIHQKLAQAQVQIRSFVI